MSSTRALLAALNEQADPAHGDLTAAVHALIALGLPGARAVLPLLTSPDANTRLRAQRVLEGSTRAHLKASTPERPLTRAVDHAWRSLWLSQGDYRWDASPAQQQHSVSLWQQWLSDPTQL